MQIIAPRGRSLAHRLPPGREAPRCGVRGVGHAGPKTGASVAFPDDGAEALIELKRRVGAAQIRAHRLVNTGLLGLYWVIGDTFLGRQAAHGWGARVIDRLAEDLRVEFQEMTGLSHAAHVRLDCRRAS